MNIPIKIPGVLASKRAIVDDEDFERVGRHRWLLHTGGYAFCHLEKKTVYMHRLIMETPSHLETDHINGNRLDNRKENLRICTAQENQRNVRYRRKSQTGIVGVYKHPSGYIAQIKRGGRNVHLGVFKAIEDAARVRETVAKKEYGRFYPNE